jgi:hypothetical protein
LAGKETRLPVEERGRRLELGLDPVQLSRLGALRSTSPMTAISVTAAQEAISAL